MSFEDDLRRGVGERVEAVRLRHGTHPEPQDLLAYYQGALELAEEERMQDHLVACPQCTELLIGLDRMADPAAGDAASPAEKAAAWRLVWSRLQQEKAAGRVPPNRRLPPAYALAACLAAALGGAALWVGTLSRTVGELSRPQVNAPVLDLKPATRGEETGSAAVPVPEVPAGARLFTLVLNPAAPAGEGVYRAEVLDSARRSVWSGEGLRPNAFDSFSLTFSRRTLGPGAYRLLLQRASGSHSETIADYAFRVQAP